MTKSARIMALHSRGLSTREIALAVYGEAIDKRMAYVRIVTRQRLNGRGNTPAQIKYIQSGGKEKRRDYSKRRYAEIPEVRKRKLVLATAWRKANRERHNQHQAAYRAKVKERTCLALTNQ